MLGRRADGRCPEAPGRSVAAHTCRSSQEPPRRRGSGRRGAWGPAADGVEALCPLARRSAIADELVSEDGDSCRHCNDVGQAQLCCQPPVVRVVTHGRGDRLGDPVQRDDGEQEVAGESGAQIPAGVRPRPPLLQHPRSQAGRRVFEPIPDRLRPGRLDRAPPGRQPPRNLRTGRAEVRIPGSAGPRGPGGCRPQMVAAPAWRKCSLRASRPRRRRRRWRLRSPRWTGPPPSGRARRARAA